MKSFLVFFVLILAILPTPGQAGTQSCKVDDTKGGKCADWEIKISKSKFSDKPLTGARTLATETLRFGGKNYGKPNIFLLCKEGITAFLLSYGRAVAPTEDQPVTVGLRLDKQQPFEIEFETTPGPNSIILKNEAAKSLAKRISSGKNLIIRMPLTDGAYHDAEFSLNGFKESIPYISEPCEWQRSK